MGEDAWEWIVSPSVRPPHPAPSSPSSLAGTSLSLCVFHRFPRTALTQQHGFIRGAKDCKQAGQQGGQQEKHHDEEPQEDQEE